jgi:hypothetical protein
VVSGGVDWLQGAAMAGMARDGVDDIGDNVMA